MLEKGMKTPNQQFQGSNLQMIGSHCAHKPEQPSVDEHQETTDKLVEAACSSFKEPQTLKACIKRLTKNTIEEPLL